MSYKAAQAPLTRVHGGGGVGASHSPGAVACGKRAADSGRASSNGGSGDFDAVLFEQSIDGHAGYAQQTGRLGNVVVAVAQGMLDRRPLSPLTGFLEIDDLSTGTLARIGQIEIRGSDEGSLRHDRGLADPVDQLAHIAGPAVTAQREEGIGAEGIGLCGRLGADLREEVRRQRLDIVAAFAQGGHLELQDIQTVKEILPKCLRLDRGLEIEVDVRRILT